MSEIKWATNYNGKLSCNAFVHIDFLPTKNVDKSEYQNKVFEIVTLDRSHPSVFVYLLDIRAVPLHTKPLTDLLCLTSHGMLEKEFVDYLFLKHKEKIGTTEQIGIYFYKKAN